MKIEKLQLFSFLSCFSLKIKWNEMKIKQIPLYFLFIWNWLFVPCYALHFRSFVFLFLSYSRCNSNDSTNKWFKWKRCTRSYDAVIDVSHCRFYSKDKEKCFNVLVLWTRERAHACNEWVTLLSFLFFHFSCLLSLLHFTLCLHNFSVAVSVLMPIPTTAQHFGSMNFVVCAFSFTSIFNFPFIRSCNPLNK